MTSMATKKPKGLGRGLEALLGPTFNGPDSAVNDDSAAAPNPTTLQLDQMVPGVYQPRTRMDEGALYELAESIKAQGIMQPILVRRLDADAARDKKAEFEIIAGERRFRAAGLAGLESVPVLVRDVPNEAAAAMSLIENIQREDLSPMEEAVALNRLQEEFALTHQQVADAVGKSRATVTNLLRLLALAPDARTLLERGDLEMGHARAILALAIKDQGEIARQVVARALSVRQTEALIRKIQSEQPVAGKVPPARVDPDIRRLQDEISEKTGAPVQLQHTARGKGKLVINYNSLDELDGILRFFR